MTSKILAFVCCCIALLLAFAASAHPARTSAVFLDVKSNRVAELEMQMPLDQLLMAVPELSIDENVALSPQALQLLRSYVSAHMSAALPDGRSIAISTADFVQQRIDEAPYIVGHARMKAPLQSSLARFSLHYDVILHRVVTHKTYVSIRNDFNRAIFARPQLLDVIRFQHSSIDINRASGSHWNGFVGMLRMGAQHILEGTDHLLFLLVLLLPAPLVMNEARRYVLRPIAACIGEVLKIVSAFTAGHSITLLLGAVGLAVLPSQPVEVLVAASIVFSAAAAVWPRLNTRAWWLAGGFGLVHGLAFADALTSFGFGGSTLLLAVAGFNLGVEVMQLMLVAAVLPVLLLLARTRYYIRLRNGAAALATVMAVLWIIDRLFPALGILDLLSASVRTHVRLLLLSTLVLAVLVLEFMAWRSYRLGKISNSIRNYRLRRSVSTLSADNPAPVLPR